jgi:hypothetical protein
VPARKRPNIEQPRRADRIAGRARSCRQGAMCITRKAMDALYRVCRHRRYVAGLISAVFLGPLDALRDQPCRSWPEPMAVLLTIVLTFFDTGGTAPAAA